MNRHSIAVLFRRLTLGMFAAAILLLAAINRPAFALDATTDGLGETTVIEFGENFRDWAVGANGRLMFFHLIFFHRDTGKIEGDRLTLPTDPLANAEIQRVYFSPDGRNMLFQIKIGQVQYLHSEPLNLSAEERKQIEAAR